MPEISIRAEQLGKAYRIGHSRNSNPTLREAVATAFAASVKRLRTRGRVDEPRPFWALQDVSFEICQGDSVGIIGNNGAGKSTLLKILSRITKPTTGRAVMRGRVASLLEVGTGFHPELTGRENVYLSGAILGMRWEEIRSRFDEIVDFAEVRKFIDTPVKRYSSGMYLRLAFAVAAHLDPDVLIVDEVLAVGDAAFQQKCLGRMTDFTRQGRTVVFVSHNLGAVQTLCRRALLVQNGRLIADDTAAATVARYLVGLESKAAEDLSHRTDRAGTGQVRLTAIRIASTSASAGSSVLVTGQPARFEFLFAPKLSSPTCSFTIYDRLGQPVTFFDSSVRSQADDIGAEAISRAVCDVGELLLMPGRYRINAAIGSGGEIHDRVEGAMFFEVEEGHIGGRPITRTSGYGSAVMHHRWTGLFEPAQLTFQTWTESE